MRYVCAQTCMADSRRSVLVQMASVSFGFVAFDSAVTGIRVNMRNRIEIGNAELKGAREFRSACEQNIGKGSSAISVSVEI